MAIRPSGRCAYPATQAAYRWEGLRWESQPARMACPARASPTVHRKAPIAAIAHVSLTSSPASKRPRLRGGSRGGLTDSPAMWRWGFVAQCGAARGASITRGGAGRRPQPPHPPCPPCGASGASLAGGCGTCRRGAAHRLGGAASPAQRRLAGDLEPDAVRARLQRCMAKRARRSRAWRSAGSVGPFAHRVPSALQRSGMRFRSRSADRAVSAGEGRASPRTRGLRGPLSAGAPRPSMDTRGMRGIPGSRGLLPWRGLLYRCGASPAMAAGTLRIER